MSRNRSGLKEADVAEQVSSYYTKTSYRHDIVVMPLKVRAYAYEEFDFSLAPNVGVYTHKQGRSVPLSSNEDTSHSF
jgi:hypothetical protein